MYSQRKFNKELYKISSDEIVSLVFYPLSVVYHDWFFFVVTISVRIKHIAHKLMCISNLFPAKLPKNTYASNISQIFPESVHENRILHVKNKWNLLKNKWHEKNGIDKRKKIRRRLMLYKYNDIKRRWKSCNGYRKKKLQHRLLWNANNEWHW